MILLCSATFSVVGQESFLWTKSFDRKMKRMGLEFFQPVERWMKPALDQFEHGVDFDLILHSPPDIEVRVRLEEEPPRRPLHPNVYITNLVSTLATNDQNALIRMTAYQLDYARQTYGADLAIYADFVPKQSFSSAPQGRILCLYRQGEGLVSYVILYTGEELDPFFELPLMFDREE